MRRRHVKAIALATLVFVTLTGARRGGGDGGCDDDSSGSSSTSTTGGDYASGGGGDDIDVPDAPSIDPGGSSGRNGGSTGGHRDPHRTSSPNDATSDVTITHCDYDEAARKFVASVTVTNSGPETYRYHIGVQVKQTSGSSPGALLASDFVIVEALPAGQTTTVKAEGARPVTESINFRCEVDRAKRYPSSN